MQTDTDSRPKKSSSPKKSSTTNAAVTKKLLSNEWWPFARVDGKLLERLNKKHIEATQGEALW